jgi:hypothetical protein
MTIIKLLGGSQFESWLIVRDGLIIHHVENDGYAVARNGLRPREEPITLEDVRARYGRSISDQAWAALSQQFL